MSSSKEIVTISIGQAGNQIAWKFFDLLSTEYFNTPSSQRTSGFSTFFRKSFDGNIKARSILVDMEENVINQIMASPVGNLYEKNQSLMGQTGSGNNFASGFAHGNTYVEEFRDKVRKQLEYCNSPQAFFVMHSCGGGTGSGLGSYFLRNLHDEYPELLRVTCSVFPSLEGDDVVTSPYNFLLSANHLINQVDCTIPLQNDALSDICTSVDKLTSSSQRGGGSSALMQASNSVTFVPSDPGFGKKLPFPNDPNSVATPRRGSAFDSMNMLGAHVMSDLTSSMRFPGELNMDLSELATTLVPFPKLHFLQASVAPLVPTYDITQPITSRKVDELFAQAFQGTNQLLKCDTLSGKTFCAAFLLRGQVPLVDVRRNVSTWKQQLKVAPYSSDAFKLSLCSTPASVSSANTNGTVNKFSAALSLDAC
jgi:tubulin epsilon